jgi:hypothetical protein
LQIVQSRMFLCFPRGCLRGLMGFAQLTAVKGSGFIMTREEFIAQQQNLIPRKPKRWGIAYLVAFGAQLAGLSILVFCDYKRWPIGWTGISSVAVLVVSPTLMRWYMRRRFGVRCPCCRRALSVEDAGIALFSGYCWYCHKKIVTNEAEPSASANGAPRGR